MKNKIFLIGIILIIFIALICFLPNNVNASDSEGNFVIVLDPGHGGGDPGAVAGGLREDQVNFKIAQFAKEELEQYEGVKVYITRYNNCPSIYDRVEIAKEYKADLLVSLHINSGSGGNSTGAAIWVTQDKTQIEYYQKAEDLANKMLTQLSYLGIKNNGVQTRSGQPNEWYDSGVVQDYYGIIRYAQRVKMRSILVEHCFIDNSSDRNFINNDDKIRKIAKADVQGIVEAYQLKKKGTGSVPIKEFKLNINELNMEITNDNAEPIYYFTPIFSPDNATNKQIEWYSSDSSIVRVYEGKIRALREGEVIIKAITKNNQKIATCKVIVTKPKNPLTNISIDKEERELEINEKTHINISFYPDNATDKTLYWESSNPDIVRVYDGDIRGLKEGVSIITATSRAGAKQVKCRVVVKDPNKIYVEEIKTEQEEYTIGINQAETIEYSFLPKNAENTDFSWSSSNPEVLRVYWNQIRGLKEGTAELIIKTPDGITEKRVKIHVKNIKVEEIIPEKDEYTIDLNEVIDIKYSYLPENANNTNFSWTASDPNILSVYWNKVRGLKPGTAYIIVKTDDGTVEKRIKVTVRNNSNISIVPEEEEYLIEVNNPIDIKCNYVPNTLTAQDFIWKAEDPSILSVYWDKIRGLREGTTNLIIESLDGTYVKKIKIKVQKEQMSIIPKKETYTIKVNEPINIECEYNPSYLTAQDFTWKAENPNILSVYWDKVRGLKEGKTNLIIESLDGTYVKKIQVTVHDENILVVPKEESYMIKVDEPINIECEYNPSNLTSQDFTWKAEDPTILSVYWDKIRGLKEGTTNLIIESLDGTYSTKIKITIKK